MRFELQHGRCCPSQLRRGEALRVPRSKDKAALGFYVSCPSCARPQVLVSRAIDSDHGVDFVEGDGMIKKMSPAHACDRCGVRFRVDHEEIILEPAS